MRITMKNSEAGPNPEGVTSRSSLFEPILLTLTGEELRRITHGAPVEPATAYTAVFFPPEMPTDQRKTFLIACANRPEDISPKEPG